MSQTLTQGANAPLPGTESLQVEVTWAGSGSGPGLDAAALLVAADGRVRSDEDFVFFNQPSSPDGSVRHVGGTAGRETLAVEPARIPEAIERVVVTASVDAAAPAGTTFASVPSIEVTVRAGESPVVSFAPAGLTTETALVLIELYRRQGAWKVRAIGQGYAAGLAGIATTYGISVAEEEPAPAPAAPEPADPPVAPPGLNLAKPMPAGLPVDLAKRLGPRLEKADAVILRKGLSGVTAQVALVVDFSGSMSGLVHKGTVATTTERVMAVAARFDDDGRMDVWQFAQGFRRLPPLDLAELDGYVAKHMRQMPKGIGIGNNEPAVMKDVLAFYKGEPSVPLGMTSKEARELEKVEPRRGLRRRRKGGTDVERAVAGTDPVYVVFVSDGGIYKNDAIRKVLTEASEHPIFWQFIGIGDEDYGVLEEFDSMTGRRVDNAGFFSLDDIDQVGDDELYDRMLSEFPQWLRDARAAGVLS